MVDWLRRLIKEGRGQPLEGKCDVSNQTLLTNILGVFSFSPPNKLQHLAGENSYSNVTCFIHLYTLSKTNNTGYNMDPNPPSRAEPPPPKRPPSPERGRSREERRRSDRSVSSKSSSSRSRHKHRKKHSDRHKEKKRRRSYSSSSDSSSSTSDSRRRKKEKKRKQRSKSKKRRSDRKKSSKKERRKKSKQHSDDSSSDEEDGPEVKRSVITGKKIKMHIDKTDDDLVRERARKEMLKFMNQSL